LSPSTSHEDAISSSGDHGRRRLGALGQATSSAPVVRGRDAELAAVGVELDRVRSGAGAVVLVEGEPGIGKSRLLAESARIARRLGFRVGAGVADPYAGAVELGPLMTALFDGPEPLLDRSELRDLRSVSEQRYWMLQDLQAILEEAAAQGPLLITLDDQHWADSGTTAALRALPARLAALPVGWVVACRPDQGSVQFLSTVEYLVRDGATKVVLGPLDDTAVAQLAADVMDATPSQSLLDLVRGARGSPFLLMELLSGLRDEELVRFDAGEVAPIQARLPRRVRYTMRERLRGMTPLAREAATVAASLGRRFSFSDLAKMLDRPPGALLGPVDELIASGMLVESGDHLAFRHDITRDAVRDSVPVSARQALDRQAADVLLSRGATPVEVATQLATSAEAGDEEAISILLRAAEALATTDPSVGADLGQRALDLTPDRHPMRGPLIARTAVLLHLAGRVDEARLFADTSLRASLPPDQEADVLFSIASMIGTPPDARVAASRQALALSELPADARAQHLAALRYNLLVGGRRDEAQAIAEEATAAVRAGGDSTATLTLTMGDTVGAYLDGRYDDSLELTEAAGRLAAEARDWGRKRLVQEWRCETRTVLDQADESLRLAAEGLALAHREHNGWAVRIFEIRRGRSLQQLGRLTDARAALDGQFGLDAARHYLGVLDAAGIVALGRIAIHTGDGRLQERTATLAGGLLEDSTPSYRRQAAWLLALQAMASGDPSAAHGWLCVLGEAERTTILPLFPADVTDEPQLVRIALAAADGDLAAAAVAQAQRRAERNPHVPTILATAAHANGLLHADDATLTHAVELFEMAPWPLARASALEDLGVLRIRNGETAAGIEALDLALVVYAEGEASWDAGRVRSRLREHGVRRRLAPRERPETGWAALTDTELAVARLVAQGLTNRAVAEQLFVSPHTVSSHLRSIFAKLGVNSRVALTRLAAENDRRPVAGWPEPAG
jgi:DNA-binding CsgD family transcriptional regulator/tetratricopeptide (TPR) repeat protein